MAKKAKEYKTPPSNEGKKEVGLCGECALCTPKMDFHLLSLKGEPTLGTCPEEEFSVLLSQQGCQMWKRKVVANQTTISK